LDDRQVVESLRALVGHSGLVGAACLSTCNRTEFYLQTRSAAEARRATSRFFHYLEGRAQLAGLVMSRTGSEAMVHLFRVASGLDSAILGEAQVLSQFKRAHRLARDAGTLSGDLDLLMRRAIETSKLVRSTTGISRQAVGYGQVAVEAARRRLGDLTGLGVLMVGGGSIGGAAARLLAGAGCAPILVARRGPRAQALAQAVDARLVELTELREFAGQISLVVCSTSSQARVLTAADVAALRGPKGRLLILDLAVPRDVEPEAGELDGVELLDLDDLGEEVAANLKAREMHRPQAELAVSRAVEAVWEELAAREAGPTIARLVDRAEVVRRGELRRAMARMPQLGDAERRQLERLTQAIAAKLIHPPIAFLRENADDPERRRIVEEVFDLSPVEDGGAP
jgi:glutamyl-tRNA reductase